MRKPLQFRLLRLSKKIKYTKFQQVDYIKTFWNSEIVFYIIVSKLFRSLRIEENDSARYR